MEELRTSVVTKDGSVHRLRSSLDEQIALVQSLRPRCDDASVGSQGSVLNEIEDLVLAHMRGEIPADGAHDMLQDLLPRTTQLTTEAPATPWLTNAEQTANELTVKYPLKLVGLQTEKLDECVRLYAASTQHLAGMKIVTPESAHQMDSLSLRRLLLTLKDLVAARSQRLIEVSGKNLSGS